MKMLLTSIICMLALTLQAQKITVEGTVYDNGGLPLAGVNVIVKGTSKGTQTDYNGDYKIKAQVGQTLVYSYIGCNTVEKSIKKNATIMNIKMTADSQALDEVVVTGYGIPRVKKAPGYAVSTLEAEAVESRPSNSVVQTLNGRVPGVQISNDFYGGPVSNNEDYARIQENIFKRVGTAPLSTFSIDVDKAGYSNVRRMINNGQKVPYDAGKI